MWVIIKLIENEKGIKLPIVILDAQNEIWEFDTYESAETMRKCFQENSDSGYEYILKKI